MKTKSSLREAIVHSNLFYPISSRF